MTHDRREFLRLATTAAALGVFSRRSAAATVAQLVTRGTATPQLAPDDPTWAAIISGALEAAKAAGATYADIRLDLSQVQELNMYMHNASGAALYRNYINYGVRALIDGQWGFVGTEDPTVNAAADIARRAVAQAKVNAKLRSKTVELAPAPVVSDGHWDAPIEIDPFTVNVDEQQDTLLAGNEAALKLKGIKYAFTRAKFTRVRRMFASTDGSHITQTLYVAEPAASVGTPLLPDTTEWTSRSVRAVDMAAKGYEIIRDAKLSESMPQAGEEALRANNPKPVEVGRYDLVLSASVAASVLGGTIGLATGASRALGREMNHGGTSFAAPPHDVLGTMQMGSKLLTVRADRSLPKGLATVGWDDEGVKPDEFAIVQDGLLVDYITTRDSASEFAWWYAKRGQPLHSHGCAAGGGQSAPEEILPNLSLQPGSAGTSVEDLIKDVKKGIYFSDDGYGNSDQQLINGFWGASSAQEIRNGKLVGYLENIAFQFRTQQFWKSLDALGGPETVEGFGMEWNDLQTIRAVPARFRQVNVENTGRLQ